jgi:hypothetical protein
MNATYSDTMANLAVASMLVNHLCTSKYRRPSEIQSLVSFWKCLEKFININLFFSLT